MANPLWFGKTYPTETGQGRSARPIPTPEKNKLLETLSWLLGTAFKLIKIETKK